MGCALRSAFGPKPRAKPAPGAKPNPVQAYNGEAKPRRTSGGKAAIFHSITFCAKPNPIVFRQFGTYSPNAAAVLLDRSVAAARAASSELPSGTVTRTIAASERRMRTLSITV